MTGAQRLLAALGLRPVDRTPVMPVLLMQGARMLGIPLRDYFAQPTRLAEGQLRLVERFGHDAVFAIPHIVQDVLPWGAGLDFHEDGPPSVNRMVIGRAEEIPALRVPDPAAHPYLQRSLQAARALAQAVKGEKLVVGGLIGPFSLPSMLMGTRRFLELLEDASLHRLYLGPLMEKMLEYTTRWARAQFEAGCDLLVVAEGMASASILDEATFLKQAKPVLRRFAEQVRGSLALEWVGEGLPFLHHAKDLPVAAFLIGESDPVDQARRAIGPQRALVGNLNNLKLIWWKPERVRFEARRVLTAAGPGFILANQGPDMPWQVPDANIDALVAAARDVAAANGSGG